jgi:phage baseplate assembly protein W
MILKDITSADWSFGLASDRMVQGEDDIAQCVFIILTTQQGSDPLRPTFGVDLLSYIDQPMNIAAANLTREIAKQINTWEPRVVVTNVAYKIEVSQITYRVKWERVDGIENTTEVTYNIITTQ